MLPVGLELHIANLPPQGLYQEASTTIIHTEDTLQDASADIFTSTFVACKSAGGLGAILYHHLSGEYEHPVGDNCLYRGLHP